MAEFRPTTCTGTELFVVELLPSWPRELRPQAYTCPFVASARLWYVPPSIAEIVGRPMT